MENREKMTNSFNVNLDSFSHGQIKSKLWLCESLEPYLPSVSTIAILGSWYNILSFMLLTRNNKNYESIVGIDQDIESIEISNKINNYWILENKSKFKNIHEDVNVSTLDSYNVVINSSPEHMEKRTWFDNIAAGTLVCIQSSNMLDPDHPWYIKNPSPNIDSFASKYPLSKIMFLDTLPIRYNDWGYDRYMIIGIK